MRSALSQAVDILGEDADPEQLSALWCVISHLVWERLPSVSDTPAYAAASGAERVRMLLGAAVDISYIVDGTEPEAVLRGLGLGRMARRGAPADD